MVGWLNGWLVKWLVGLMLEWLNGLIHWGMPEDRRKEGANEKIDDELDV